MENRKNQEKPTQIYFHKYLNNLGFTCNDLKGKKILDVGSGSSKFAQEAKRHGIEIISIDLYNLFDKPRETSNVISDAEKLPFKDESFDLVVSNNCVYLINLFGDVSAAIREAKRVLRSRGEFRFDSDSKSYASIYREIDPAIQFKKIEKKHIADFGYCLLRKD